MAALTERAFDEPSTWNHDSALSVRHVWSRGLACSLRCWRRRTM